MRKREQPYFVKDGKFMPEKGDYFRFCFHRKESSLILSKMGSLCQRREIISDSAFIEMNVVKSIAGHARSKDCH